MPKEKMVTIEISERLLLQLRDQRKQAIEQWAKTDPKEKARLKKLEKRVKSITGD